MRQSLVGFVIVAGTLTGGLACQGSPAQAGAPLEGTSAARHSATVVPKPIAGGDYFPASGFHRAGIIHQFYPVPPPPVSIGDGIWAEPNGITDFNGFVAQIFQGGTAVDSDGKQYVVDVDNRVYVGEYVGTTGERAYGAFCEI